MNNFIRAEGNPKIAMFTMLIGAILNTILDPIFIFVFKWGIQGAALATIISQMVSAVWVLYYFFSGNSLLKFHAKNMKLNFNIIKGITAIGLAPFSMQIAASLLQVIMNNSLSEYGNDIAVSAMGAIQSIMMLILMPIFGINQGVQPIIGYNYGAQKYDRVKEALTLAIGAATIVVIMGFGATRLFPEQLIAMFNKKDTELIKLGSHALLVFFTFLPVIGFQIVSAAYFQAVGKPLQSMVLSLSRQMLLLIPALLILPRLYGLEGIWYAGPFADFGSAVITGLWLLKELKSLQERHDKSLETQPQPE
jgi:putative MATE family efflux protein